MILVLKTCGDGSYVAFYPSVCKGKFKETH